MRWQDERYVRFYTRNTPEWCVLDWKARALFGLILREVDRAGILELGKLGLRAVAVAVRAPWEEIEKPLLDILADGMAVHRDDLRLLVVPNFIDAQEAPQSDKARKRAERERARDLAKAKSLTVTAPSGIVTLPSGIVTDSHTPSREVTSGHSVPSVPSRAVPSLAVLSEKNGTHTPRVDPEFVAIRDRIRRWPIFAALNSDRLADEQLGWMISKGLKLPWVLEAIDACAAKCADGTTYQAKHSMLVGFMHNAKRPKNQPPQARTASTDTPDEVAPTDAELAANRKRMDARAAAAKAERERREKLGIK